MRDGNLVEQHISELVWMAKVLEYTGLLTVRTESENIDIFFKEGFLVHDIHTMHPVDLLHRIAGIGKGEFIFFDGRELDSVSNKIEIIDELPLKLIETSKKKSGFPLVLYSNEVMSARIDQVRLARFPGNISPSTKKLYELCADSPTIDELSDRYNVSPKTILEVADEGIQLGVLNLLSYGGQQIPKMQIKNYIIPTSFQLTFLAEATINKSLTARKGRIHISTAKEMMMNGFSGTKAINAKIGDGYFSTNTYKLEPNEILMTKADFESVAGENQETIEVTLVKGV